MVVKAVVVGGGISGLSAAYYLQRKASERGLPLEITLLEKDSRLGGKILTESIGDFVIEGGADAFVSTKPWAVDLCRELKLEDRLQEVNLQKRSVFVLQQGKLVALPDGLVSMVPTMFWPIIKSPLLSLKGKLRMALDFLLPARKEDGDESIGELFTRRFGREAYEKMFAPLMSGIYAGDGDRLSAQSTFPLLREWERRHASLIRGALALKRQRRQSSFTSKKHSIFLTPRAGLAEIFEALVERLSKVDLRTGIAARDITRYREGYQVTTDDGQYITADAIILATPSFAAASMVRGLDPTLSTLLGEIKYVSSATVSLAFREEDLHSPLNGHGYIVPHAENRAVLACTWTSSKFPHRAPKGYVLLRLFIRITNSATDHDPSDEVLIEIASRELAKTLELIADPMFTRVYRWPSATPQYNLGHSERIAAIQGFSGKYPGLFLAGAGYTGIGIPDCIHSGKTAAENAFEHLIQRSISRRLKPDNILL